MADDLETPDNGEANRPLRADAARNVEQVLASAPGVLADDPSASMERVAEAAGIARATLYRHFETREDLIAAIYHRALSETLAAIESAEAADGPADQALRRVIESVLSVGDRYRFVAVNHPDSAEIREHEMQIGIPLIELFERGQKEGSFSARLPAQLCAAYFGGLVTSSVRLVDDGNVSVAEAAAAAWFVLVNGISKPA